jgi:hypothetical protein
VTCCVYQPTAGRRRPNQHTPTRRVLAPGSAPHEYARVGV